MRVLGMGGGHCREDHRRRGADASCSPVALAFPSLTFGGLLSFEALLRSLILPALTRRCGRFRVCVVHPTRRVDVTIGRHDEVTGRSLWVTVEEREASA
ncbi:unnamed protein product [Mycena citricolor]|uniref:Uncharacterized protein n=1 Tax=Mycena citricolor TaxID=2018698 RepID=A0AAD2HT41_9AGAR|nr:unnamed protein product [Mycena citricolor]